MDKKYLKISIYAFTVIAVLILLTKTVDNLTGVFTSVQNFFQSTLKMISPFIYGFCLAYLLNPLVVFFEKHLSKNIHKKSVLRGLSIFITYVFIIICIGITMVYFIPEITESVSNFVSSLPDNIQKFEKNMYALFDKIQFIDADQFKESLNSMLTSIISKTENLPLEFSKYLTGTLSTLSVVLTGTASVFSLILNIILGIVISFYLLASKESFISYIKKILYSIFNEHKVTPFLANAKRVDDIFKNFIVGKTIDSFIIGVLCFIGLNILKTPFITLISVIVGITNMIPYFGPFIGGIPSVFIILLTMPSKAIWVAVFILILQQFDGIILGPKILGQTVGISPIWIILSITIGGAIMGPLGMFLGVPIFASIKLFFCEYIERRFDSKYGDIDIESIQSKN